MTQKYALVLAIMIGLGALALALAFGDPTPTAHAHSSAAPDACATPIKKTWGIKGNCGTNSAKHFIGTTDTQALVFKTNKIERMRIGADGNVGIGTTNPTHALHIVAAAAVLRLESSQNNGIAQTEYATDARRWYTGSFGSTAGTLAGKYYIKDDTTGQSRLVIDTSGNVGIGTISPVSRLTVNGGADFSGNVGIGTSSPQHMLQIGDDLAGRLGLDPSDASPNAGYLRFGDNTGWRLHIARARESSGGALNTGTTGAILTVTDKANVGIGEINPSNILTIQQNSTTDPIADAWTTYSSRRWKTEIATLDHALEKIEELRGVSFAWREDGKRDIGLIAEEVGAVFPEIVTYEANGVDARGVDYARLVAVLIQGVKEQQQQITSQQQRIDALEARLTALEQASQGQLRRQPASVPTEVWLMGAVALLGMVVWQRIRPR